MKKQRTGLRVSFFIGGWLFACIFFIGFPFHRALAAIGQQTLITRPLPTSKPIFLRDTVEIKPYAKATYWKFPNQRDYTSWIPQISFQVFYDDSVKLRYQAEWFNPDGTPWFSEALRYSHLGTQTARLSSEYSDELLNTKAVITTGTFAVKITDSKTNALVFQGKFKVYKQLEIPGDAKLKNRLQFYVDNDWNLPIGYVGFNYSGTSWANPQPIVFMWFKGRLQSSDFEARLFYNGQEIATTDGGGYVNTSQERGSDCLKFIDTCQYHLWEFYWSNFIVENSNWVRNSKPNSLFTKDRPGEYTVKVFHKNVQVRETRFTIDAKGLIAPNAFSEQMYLTNYKIVVPVKILGTLDKWNAMNWKTDAFYGNPLSGFAMP